MEIEVKKLRANDSQLRQLLKVSQQAVQEAAKSTAALEMRIQRLQAERIERTHAVTPPHVAPMPPMVAEVPLVGHFPPPHPNFSPIVVHPPVVRHASPVPITASPWRSV